MRPPPPNYGPYSSEQGALRAIVDQLVEGLKPFRIYLFGSRAEGRARPDSDFDLVLADSTNAWQDTWGAARRVYERPA
jgi:predicted nucleotidyltransferase